jgi:ABC-2 type transport system permease protein
VNAVFLPVIFVSGVFYDAGKAPGFLRGIAQALPLKHVIDGLSGAMVKGTGIGSHITALGVIAAWSVLGVALAIRGFSWETGKRS